MKLKELIDKYEAVECVVGIVSGKTILKNIRRDLKQLDEPKPVKVPQFVADWLSNLKSGLFGLNYDSVSSEIYDWVYDTEDNLGKLHLAFVYGYEVEKEKRYRISMPKTRNYMNRAQILCEKDGKIFWCGEWHPFRTKFTRKELEEAGFVWVFDCEGIKIEEVEE